MTGICQTGQNCLFGCLDFFIEIILLPQLLAHFANLLAQGVVWQRASDDIAFLLGYEDTSSFLRAFNVWTGMSITEYKKR